MKKLNSLLFLVVITTTATLFSSSKENVVNAEKVYNVKSGWIKKDGKWYFTNADGTLMKSKWLFRNNVWYYFGSDGARIENGWYQHKGNKKWSYFKRGVAQKNIEVKFGKYYKYIGNDYYAVKDTWVKHAEHKWSYYGKGEYRIEHGRYQIKKNQKWSYFRNGYALENEWVYDKKTKKTYFVDGNNYISTSQWIEINNNNWSYVRADGSRVENGLYKIPSNGKYAYFQKGLAVRNKWIDFTRVEEDLLITYSKYFGDDNYMVTYAVIEGKFIDGNGNWRKKVENYYKFKNTAEFKNLIKQGLTENEAELYLLINEYRVSIGKPKFRLSKSLTTVARTHVKDSNLYHPENAKDERGMDGNCHSWSPNGNWTPVVYTEDHKYAELVWIKPSEITNYKGYGYECSYWSSIDVIPNVALKGWKKSKGHNDMIIGADYWGNLKYIGIGIDGNYSHIWFGVDEDPDGYYD